MFNFIKNLFNKKKYIYEHFCAVAKKDKNGRYRYFIYLDGELAKRELTVETWLRYEL